jgi:uncharacterized protein (TIGR02421 family)
VSAIDVLSAQDLAVDRELAAAGGSLRFLLDVTPVDLVATRHRFFADGRSPTFAYRPLRDDLAAIEARLATTPTAAVEDPSLRPLFQAKHRELELLLAMLRCRGSEQFLALSLQLYGPVSPMLLADAEVLLDRIPVPPPETGVRLDAIAFARRAEHELDHYRALYRDVAARVEIRDDSSGVMVVNGNLLVAPTATVPETRVDALLQHEIGTHVITHINGSNQPLRLLGTGLAGCDETQEGLAVFAEYLVGGLTARRLRQLAARVIAVHEMTQGVPFPEVHSNLVDNGIRPVEAFTITMRVFRSGGLTKDAVYLRGLRHVITHVAAGGRLDVLWLGKMALIDLPHVEDLLGQGVLVAPMLVPRYVAEPFVQDRLADVTPSTTLLDLIGSPA